MKTVLSILLLLPALALAQQADPTAEEFAAAQAVMTRYLNVIRLTQQNETADIEALNAATKRLADQRDALLADMATLRAEVAAMRARLDAMPALRAQQITVMTP